MKIFFYKTLRISHLLVFCLLFTSIGKFSFAQEQSHIKEIKLSQLFALADSNSMAIQSALAAKAVAEYKTKIAKSNKLPNIKANADFGYLGNIGIIGFGNMPDDYYDMPHFSNNYSIEAAWVLYAGGNIRRGIDMSVLGEKISEAAVESTRSGIRLMLTGLFTDLYVSQNQQQVLKKNIEQTKLLLKNMKNRMDAGIILESDYIRYELQLSNLKFALLQMNNQVAKICAELTETLKIQGNALLYAILENNNAMQTDNSEDVSNNSELKIAALQMQMAEKELENSRSNLKPTVSLFGSASLNRPFIYDIPAIDLYANINIVGVSISFDIGKLYKNKNQVSSAKMALSQNRANLSLKQEQTNISLRKAIIDHNEAIEHLEVAKKELELATKNYTLIVNQYNNESALITDVMDASNTKLNAELQLENAKAGIAFAYYKIKHITGKL